MGLLVVMQHILGAERGHLQYSYQCSWEAERLDWMLLLVVMWLRAWRHMRSRTTRLSVHAKVAERLDRAVAR